MTAYRYSYLMRECWVSIKCVRKLEKRNAARR